MPNKDGTLTQDEMLDAFWDGVDIGLRKMEEAGIFGDPRLPLKTISIVSELDAALTRIDGYFKESEAREKQKAMKNESK